MNLIRIVSRRAFSSSAPEMDDGQTDIANTLQPISIGERLVLYFSISPGPFLSSFSFKFRFSWVGRETYSALCYSDTNLPHP